MPETAVTTGGIDSGVLGGAIELRILVTRALDLAENGTLRARDRAYVDEMIAALEPPPRVIERLANI